MQLIKTEYIYPNRKKKVSDKMVMVLKDKNGNKIRKTITKPKISYYVTLEECDDGEYHRYLPRENVRKVTCPFQDLYKSMVDEVDDPKYTAMYRRCFDEKRNISSKLKELHLDRRVHGTDIFIDDYTIGKFLSKYDYEKNNFGITKVSFDIEVDSSAIRGFPNEDEAKCPINAISFKDIDNKIIGGFYLNYPKEKSFRKFVNEYDDFMEEIKKKYKGHEIFINFYDDEIDLIIAFFDFINEHKYDFAFCWNMDFDFVYIYNRLINLGYEPKEIMCPEEIPSNEKSVSYKIDNNPQHDLSDKHSIYTVAGYTNYIDEMKLYANITKPLGKEESYTLDYIAAKVCGIHKEEVEGNMKLFHLINYRKFIMYSLQDSFALAAIEEKTSHLDLLYTVSLITRTKIENAMKKTVSLKNMAKYYAEMHGQVQSNNRAKLFERPEGKIPGAFVANSSNIDDVGMLIIEVFKSNRIFANVTDLDLSALYPSLMRALNMFFDSLIGNISCELKSGMFNGVDFLTDYISHDPINICMRYFNLPSFDDIEASLNETLIPENNEENKKKKKAGK